MNKTSFDSIKKSLHLIRLLPVWATTILGICIILYIVLNSILANNSTIENDFTVAASERLLTLEDVLTQTTQRMSPVSAFYEASDYINRDDFEIFSQRLLNSDDSFLALQWTPYVTKSERKEFTAEVQKEIPNFIISELNTNGEFVDANNRPYYFPLLYNSTFLPNLTSHDLGYDIASNSTKHSTLKKSLQDGIAYATPPADALLGSEETSFFTLVYPIYKNNRLNHSEKYTINNVSGFATGVIATKLLVANALLPFSNRPIVIAMHDITDQASEQFVYRHTPKGKLDETHGEKLLLFTKTLQLEKTVKFAGRTWRITCTPMQNYYQTGIDWKDIYLLITWLGVVAIINAYLLVLIKQKQKVEEIVHFRTNELYEQNARTQLILNSVGDGIFSVTTSGKTIHANKTATELLGYSEKELINKNIHTLINHSKPDGSAYPESQSAIYLSCNLGKTVHIDNEFFWRKDGIRFQVEYTSTPTIDNDKNITGAVIVFKNITERKKYELELQKANAQLQKETTAVNLMQTVTTSTNEATSIENALLVGLQEICKFLDWEIGHAYIFDANNDALASSKIWHTNKDPILNQFMEQSENANIDLGRGLPGRTLASGQPIWISDCRELSPCRADSAESVGIKTGFAIPLLIKKDVAAVLEFFTFKRINYDTDTLLLIGNIGTQLGRIIERKRAEEEITLHRDNLKELVIERTKELTWVSIKAQEANKAKSEFLANISHELRTPMHAILSYSDLGIRKLETASKEKLSKYFTSINSSGERLLSLLNVLLDLSKLESGKVDFSFEPQDIRMLIENNINELLPLADAKKLTIEIVEANDAIDTLVDCDDSKISQVIINLLSNAIKFTEMSSSITISFSSATLKLTNHSEPAISVMVTDQGVGIPKNELESVFDKFIQSSKTKTGAGGTGLGLSVCKEIISAHHGTIIAENNIGKGAVFTFTIPLKQKETKIETTD